LTVDRGAVPANKANTSNSPAGDRELFNAAQPKRRRFFSLF
jgi:hypothetical protein